MNDYKQFMVFEFDSLYARGGLADCHASFDTLPEAKKHADESMFDHATILDRLTGHSE